MGLVHVGENLGPSIESDTNAIITRIKEAATIQSAPKIESKFRIEKAKSDAKQYRKSDEDGLAREISILYEAEVLKAVIRNFEQSNVVQIKC